MSEILKYKKALNFRANPRYLTRDFIVPLYTGTEPDIVPETNVDPGMIVDPSRILPKNFTDDMPFVTDENNPEDLELAAGGFVARETFKYGASKNFKEFLEKQILKNRRTYNSLDELINKSNTGINQANAVKLLKNEYPDTFKIKVEKEYFPIHENPKITLKAIEGFKKLKKWEKNPTAENWFSVFRVTEPSGKTKPSKFSQGLRNYIQGKEGEGAIFNRYFDEIQLNENLYNKIKTYDKNLANTLKAKIGSKVARKAILEKSNEAINNINEQFKFDSTSSLEEITEALYGNQFKNADKKNKLILLTQTSDDVLKYLKVLQGARPEQAKKINLPNQETINDIVDNIAAGKKGGFRFQEGTLRQYKFDIRDTLLGLESGTSSQLRQKVVFGGKRVIDESVGLSATYERAPGYTEASQFLSPETNKIKGQVIDRPFKRTLAKALDGDLSEVKEYNKIARQFKKEYPNVDVPIIEIGKNPNEVIKYFDSFSKEAQKNILDIYNKSNISIRTNSKPLSVLVDEYQKAEKLEGKAKTTAFTALGLTSAGIANAEEVSDLTPMEASVLPNLSEIKEVIEENPITSGALATAAPLVTEKGRNIYGKIGKGLLKTLNVAGTPLGVAAYEAAGPGGLRESIQEGKTTEDIVTDPLTYASLPFANIASKAVSNPTLQKILSLGLPARAVGALTPIGLTAMGATTAYQGVKSIKEEIERRSLLTPEEREQEDIDREAERGRLAETGQYAEGGRIGFKDGTDNPNEKPVIPIDPLSDDTKPTNIMDTKLTRRQVIGGIGIAAGIPVMTKLIKTAQTAKLASKIKIESTEGMYPWFPKLVEKIKKIGEPFEEKDLIMEPSYKNSPRPFTSRPPTGEEKLTKHIDGDTTFILREYPDGRIAVDIDSPRNQQSFGQPVSLYYRPKMEFKNYKGETKIEPPEFKVLEPEPRPFVSGPDDVDITFTEIPKNPKRDIVFADIEAAERFATGKIENRKVIPVKQSLRNEMEEDPSTFIMRQSGELGSEAQPEKIIKIPEEKATGGRVGFGGGGPAAIKFARMITDLLKSLKQDLSFSSHLVKLHGPEVAKKEMVSPYRIPEGTNKSKQSDILMRIDEIKQNLPKEYSGLINTLDDIEKNVSNYNYIDASKKGTVLLEKLPDSFNFEKLPQDLFPMEDPLNDAFILFDPKREKMVGRYTMRYAVDSETGKGIIQTYDTYDPASKKFLEEKDWKLIGVDAREESGAITKEGLN